jgi:hypothetical protein
MMASGTRRRRDGQEPIDGQPQSEGICIEPTCAGARRAGDWRRPQASAPSSHRFGCRDRRLESRALCCSQSQTASAVSPQDLRSLKQSLTILGSRVRKTMMCLFRRCGVTKSIVRLRPRPCGVTMPIVRLRPRPCGVTISIASISTMGGIAGKPARVVDRINAVRAARDHIPTSVLGIL